MEWQREALRNLRAAAPVSARKPDIRLRLTPGFLMVIGLAALPLAGGRSGLAALSLLLALVIHQLPALLVACGSGIALLTLDGCGASVERAPARSEGAGSIGVSLLGTLLNLASALALGRLGQGFGGETRLHAMLGVATTVLAAWGVAQLLPFVPFHVGRMLARALTPRDRLVFTSSSLALVLGGGLMAVTATQLPSLLVVVLASGMFGFAAWRNAITELADENSGISALAARAEQAIDRGRPSEAVIVARSGLSVARSRACRRRLHAATYWGAVGAGDPFLAHSALAQLPSEAITVHLVAAYLRVCGRLGDAEALLLRARSLGQRTRETTKLLIDIQLLLGRVNEPAQLAREDEALLDATDRAVLHDAGF